MLPEKNERAKREREKHIEPNSNKQGRLLENKGKATDFPVIWSNCSLS
jgi:hypothetical protein